MCEGGCDEGGGHVPTGKRPSRKCWKDTTSARQLEICTFVLVQGKDTLLRPTVG